MNAKRRRVENIEMSRDYTDYEDEHLAQKRPHERSSHECCN